MSTFYYVPQYFTTQLSVAGGIDDTQTTGIVLQSISGVDETKPGIIAVTWSNPIDTTKVEYITYTSINATTKELQGVTRGEEGYSAKSHVNGATVAWPLSKSHINNIPDSTTTFSNKDLTSLTNSIYGNSLYQQAIINGGFTVNQRVYVSNATLAAGVYGHDRWKAGAGGGDYTFTQLSQATTITIKTGKSLIQVIEDKNVIGGTYTLSWTGTAQARFGIDSATPSGAYAASPITITTQTAGTVMSVEFNEGTLGNVVLNSGDVALPFMPKSFEEELRACQRYYELFGCGITGAFLSTAIVALGGSYQVSKRIVPTISLTTTSPIISESGTADRTGSGSAISGTIATTVSGCVREINGFSGGTQYRPCGMNGDYLSASSEL